MKIVKLKADNFKKLSAVEITPDGNLVLITGKNGAGKSSVLDSIEAALCGGRNLPKKPIKEGEIDGEVQVDMGDYLVTRKFFGSGTRLVVEAKGETRSKVSRPQEFLDNLVGSISFDPLEFLKKDSKQQRTTILEFLKLNLDEFDSQIEDLKEKRSEVLSNKEKHTHLAEAIPFAANLPENEQSSADLIAQLREINEHNTTCMRIQSENSISRSRIQQTITQIHEAENTIKQWQAHLEALLRNKKELEGQIKWEQPERNSAEVESSLEKVEAVNFLIRKNKERKALLNAAEEDKKTYSELGNQIKMVEVQKAKKLAEFPMPVPGLTVLPDGLAYNGIPLEQVNEAVRLQVCVAVSMALNPKLRVIRINGNGLDQSSLAAIAEMVKEKDYQIWVEKVSDDKSLGFFIEDGQLISE